MHRLAYRQKFIKLCKLDRLIKHIVLEGRPVLLNCPFKVYTLTHASFHA